MRGGRDGRGEAEEKKGRMVMGEQGDEDDENRGRREAGQLDKAAST